MSRSNRTSVKSRPKRAAVAFNVTPQTVLKYCTATERKRTADEVLTGLQAQLMPVKREPPAASA